MTANPAENKAEVVKLVVRIDPDLRAAALAQAKLLGRSLESVVVELLRGWVRPEILATMRALKEEKKE